MVVIKKEIDHSSKHESNQIRDFSKSTAVQITK